MVPFCQLCIVLSWKLDAIFCPVNLYVYVCCTHTRSVLQTRLVLYEDSTVDTSIRIDEGEREEKTHLPMKLHDMEEERGKNERQRGPNDVDDDERKNRRTQKEQTLGLLLCV